ncbi:unnamed protein product [Closterium sp. NIES-65]|nr:unnamed protein product [Closterium sp. NIES-65]
MTAAEEEALAESGEDLLVEDLPEGLINELTCSPGHPAAKKACMDTGAGHTSINSPATSSDSALAQPSRSPMPLAAAAPASPSSGPMPTPAATVASPNAPALHAAAYASVVAGVNPAPALPASLFASPAPGGSPRNLRRARTTTATSMLLPLRRRVVVTLLLPEAVLGSHRTELLAGINAQLCGFMFDSSIIPPFEHTVGESLRVARRVYGRLLFSWPSQEDAAAFRKLFPLMLKISNSRPVMLKVYVDRFEAFTAAKAAGAPTLSIRKFPLEFDPEDIRASLLGTTDEDGAHWLADLTDFHRASDPYEDTFFTHLAGLPVATPDDPNFERIPSEIMLETNKPAMLLNFSSHVCSLCGNNHRASHHEAFAARRRGRLTNKNTISIAQLQQANGAPPHPASTPVTHLSPTVLPSPAPHVVGLLLTLPPSPHHPPLPALSNPYWQTSLPRRSALATNVPSSVPPTVGPPPTLMTPPYSHSPHASSASRSLCSTLDPPLPAPTHFNPSPHNTPPPSPSEDGPPPSHTLTPHPHPPPAPPPPSQTALSYGTPRPVPFQHTPHFRRLPSQGLPRGRPRCPPPCWHGDAPLPPPLPPVSNSTLPCFPHTPTPPLPSLSPDPPPLVSPYPQSRLPHPPSLFSPPTLSGTQLQSSPALCPGRPTPNVAPPLCQQPPPPGLSHIALKQAAPPPSGLFFPPAWAPEHPRPFSAPSPLPAPPSSRCHLAHMVLPLSVLTLTSPSYPTPPTLPPPLIPAPLSTPSPPLLPPPPPNTNPIQAPLPLCRAASPPRTAARAPANPTFNLTLPTPLAPTHPSPRARCPPTPCLHPRHPPLPHSASFSGPPCRGAPTHSPALPTPPPPPCPLQPLLANFPPRTLSPCHQPSALPLIPHSLPLHTSTPPPTTLPPPSPSEDGPPPSHTLTPHPHPPPALPPPRRPHFLTEPLALFPSNTPPTLGAFPPRVSPEDGPAAHPHAGTETLPSPSLSPLFLTAPSPASPTPRLLPFPPSLPIPLLSFPPTLNTAFPTPPHSFHPPPFQGPNCNRPQRSDRAARPPTWLPPSASIPLPPVSPTLLSSRPLHPPLISSPPRPNSRTPPPLPRAFPPSLHPPPPAATWFPPSWSSPSPPPPAPPLQLSLPPLLLHIRPPPRPPCSPLLPPTAPSLAGNLLGTHAAPTAFRNDPGLLYIGLDDWVEYWTCALCDFTCGAALNSAMEHIQSNLHATRVKASAHRPAAKDDFGPWRALTLLQQKAMVTAFLRGRP